MRCIIGLGNPDAEYHGTKHNVGFAVIGEIAKESGIDVTKKDCASLIGKGMVSGKETLLVMPQTYMNLSGEAVLALIRKALTEAEDILVICDDVNLKLGRIRMRAKGSAGGHKGLKSIIDMLGRSDFARLRLGIAIDIHKGDITRYVLSPFMKRDHKHVKHMVELAKEAALYWISHGHALTMTKFNMRTAGTS